MKKIIYKKFVISNNLFLPFFVLDLKTQINYITILLNRKYQTIYLPNKITYFPSYLFLYLFSKEKKFVETFIKQLIIRIKYIYITYKLLIGLIGTGYKFFSNNKFLYLILGYSHLLKIKLPIDCTVNIDNNHKSLVLIYRKKYVLGNIFYIIKHCKKIDRYKGIGVKNILLQLKLKLNKLKITKK